MTAPGALWILMPFRNRWDLTEAALEDCLAQTFPAWEVAETPGGSYTPGTPLPIHHRQTIDATPEILLLDSSGDPVIRRSVEAWMEREPRVHAWFHQPPLPSLSAIWNLGLRFVWNQGSEHALVVNNDVRLHRETYAQLLRVAQAPLPDAPDLPLELHDLPLFVSAVGRREGDMPWAEYFADDRPWHLPTLLTHKGGPDYSCFLITRECHQAYPFDESFIPAYCEDCDHHRRLMLGGDGHRIFSVNLPYLHYGSATVNAEPDRQARWAESLKQSRQHYVRKWGGEVNHERYTIPFEAATAQDGVTNPELQRRLREGGDAGDPPR